MPNQKAVAIVNGPPCPRCGQIHTKCAAHKKAGGPCGRPARDGQNTCPLHGGTTADARANGEERRADAEAERALIRLGVDHRNVHPAEALIELVSYQASIVDFWRHKVSQIENDKDLVWGKTRKKTGGDDAGTTFEAKPNIAYTLLGEASDRLAKYAEAALKAGVQERQIRLAESQGALVAQAIRTVLDGLDLTPAQLELVPRVVPAALRLIAGEVA